MRIRWRADDTFEGLIGGGIPAVQMIATTQTLTLGSDLMGLVRRLILSITDMDPDADGNRRSFSATVSFEGRAAFVNPEFRPPRLDSAIGWRAAPQRPTQAP